MGANAQTSVPAFTAGQVLTAAQMTQVNTGIPVFASSTERDAAFGGTGEKTLAEGQYAFLEDTNETQVYDGSTWAAVGGGGKILQVVSTTKTDTFSASVTTGNFSSNITGLEATITPSAATSKVMVTLHLVGSESVEATDFFIRLMRDTTPVCVGDAAGSRAQASAGICQVGSDSGGVATLMVTYLDSPSTTSAITYGVQMSHRAASGNVYVNRTYGDSNVFANPRFASTITVQEVSA